MLKRNLFMAIIFMLAGLITHAQVTTSSMSGIVKSSSGDPLVGTTVTATHVPTGTQYRVLTRTGGLFNIPNMNPGGPYVVEATYVGFGKGTKSDIILPLGDEYRVDFDLASSGEKLR